MRRRTTSPKVLGRNLLIVFHVCPYTFGNVVFFHIIFPVFILDCVCVVVMMMTMRESSTTDLFLIDALCTMTCEAFHAQSSFFFFVFVRSSEKLEGKMEKWGEVMARDESQYTGIEFFFCYAGEEGAHVCRHI